MGLDHGIILNIKSMWELIKGKEVIKTLEDGTKVGIRATEHWDMDDLREYFGVG